MSTTALKQAARKDRAAKVQAAIAAAVICPLCPEVTAEVGLEALTKSLGPGGGRRWWNSTKTVQDSARRLTGDAAWRERALGWIDAYREAHEHGPSWRTFWNEPPLWPADATVNLLRTVMRQLNEGGFLDGTKTPFSLCRRANEQLPAPRRAAGPRAT
jgi:hypothetical protein